MPPFPLADSLLSSFFAAAAESTRPSNDNTSEKSDLSNSLLIFAKAHSIASSYKKNNNNNNNERTPPIVVPNREKTESEIDILFRNLLLRRKQELEKKKNELELVVKNMDDEIANETYEACQIYADCGVANLQTPLRRVLALTRVVEKANQLVDSAYNLSRERSQIVEQLITITNELEMTQMEIEDELRKQNDVYSNSQRNGMEIVEMMKKLQ